MCQEARRVAKNRMSLSSRSLGPSAEDRSAASALRGPLRHVLVSYQSSARGRAALACALRLAREAGARLTVVSVATKEPVTGCARCRSNAVLWNREMRYLAHEDLAEAAELVGSAPSVDYTVALGDPARAVGEAAARTHADVIVVPWESHSRLRGRFFSTLGERLQKTGRWQVIVAPAEPPRAPQRGKSRGPSG